MYNKAMAYSTDFKQRALDYIKEGHSHVEAAKVFDVASELSSRGKRTYVNKDT
ncbi:transposase domain protein [Streptococcus pseudopneumoniae SK674]|nr:transposase domain protein [Streptococcus pseudopneumoniae SK674]